MKQLILKFFLVGGIVSTSLLYSNQKKMTFDQKNSSTGQIVDSRRIYNGCDNNTSPIVCDENDKEVCEYIEQQKKSDLRIWLREQGVSLFFKLIYLKECLSKCKKVFDAWLRKLIVISY